MIRKVIIVLLTLMATTSGTIGVLSGSGCSSWSQRLWSSGEPDTTGYQQLSLFWGTTRLVLVNQLEYLDAHAVPSEKKYSGPGWRYIRAVVLNEPSSLYVRTSVLVVASYIPILLAIMFSTYPCIAFVRGPLRRWRRRRKGLCLTCGYDLTGNESGVCSECGTKANVSP